MFEELWPKPDYNKDDEPHFIFMLTPPYSGSTAITKLMDSSDKSMILHPNGEGQRMIPGMCGSGRWKIDFPVDFESVKAIWLHKYQTTNKQLDNIDFVIEKSPPNMVRFQELSKVFSSFSVFINNRDPYANVSSALYRNHDTDSISDYERVLVLKRLTLNWLTRSYMLKYLAEEMAIPCLSYEDFCHSPHKIKKMNLPDDFINTIDFGATVKIKDYVTQKISNHNEWQLKKLAILDIATISEELKEHEKILNYFGYHLY
jgi:hypothetical protein